MKLKLAEEENIALQMEFRLFAKADVEQICRCRINENQNANENKIKMKMAMTIIMTATPPPKRNLTSLIDAPLIITSLTSFPKCSPLKP